ncbi:MAG: ribonuclease HI [Desulfovibrionaceae bacterium]|nr:ribonuclease HI [Desulfovibrionaceae bacterium]
MKQQDRVTLFTDGSCLGNPGPGGFAALLVYRDSRREITGGFRATTNNRMELMAVIEGLTALTRPCRVDVFTDSRYIKDAVTRGWLDTWRSNGWRTAAKKPVKNQDLWTRLLVLLDRHRVEFHWLRGHSGHPENERCDALARAAAASPDLPEEPRARPGA